MANINVNQALASETAKGIVEEATQAQVNAGTDTGETGARTFVTPSKYLAGILLKVLTGFAAGANSTVLATDTLAQALAKFQGQINARSATGTDTTYAFRANNLSDLANVATARSNIGVAVENISLQDSSTGIAAQTYTLELYAQYAYTIDELKIISGSGTCTAAVQIDGVSVTGISAVAVSNVIATGTASAANSVAIGNKVTLVITSPTSLNNLQASLKTTKA